MQLGQGGHRGQHIGVCRARQKSSFPCSQEVRAALKASLRLPRTQRGRSAQHAHDALHIGAGDKWMHARSGLPALLVAMTVAGL